MNSYFKAFQKFGDFDGRATRSEFWYFVLINLIVAALLFELDEGLGRIYYFIALIPWIAVGVRRMHDTNKSGWFLLIPLYNLIIALQKGTNGPNKYGSNSR